MLIQVQPIQNNPVPPHSRLPKYRAVRASRCQNEDPVVPQSLAEGSQPSDAEPSDSDAELSDAEPLAPMVPGGKKRALDTCDAEDGVPGKKVRMLINVKPSEVEKGLR
jgi:hypothetical protein